MLDAVILANLAANRVGAEPAPDATGFPAEFAGPTQRIGLSEDGFARVCAQTDAWMQDLKQSYGLRG
jgi:hypothetical protein